MHKDVLLAAVRELLILDNKLDGRTLEVAERVLLGPQESDSSKHSSSVKRKLEDIESEKSICWSAGCQLTRIKDEPAFSEGWCTSNYCVGGNEGGLTRGEELAEDIVNCSLLFPEVVFESKALLSKNNDDMHLATPGRLPRKVSDADADHSLHGQMAGYNSFHARSRSSWAVTESSDIPTLSEYLDLSERNPDGSFRMLRHDLPPLMKVSIVAETSLREAALKMTTKLMSTFNDKALRRFLGYKSTSMKRNHIMGVLSEYLFDVSHAMFAWEETENELFHEKSKEWSLSSPAQFDSTIRDSLFDERSLSTIGGFDQSSLLPHALSISRLRKRNLSWREFAKSAVGRRMLRHHRNGKSLVVGQQRRNHKYRSRSPRTNIQSKEAKRARSASLSSESEQEDVKTGASLCSETHQIKPEPTIEIFDCMPDVMRLSLSREKGKSWGVLLSKEGDHCLVVRAPGSPHGCMKAGLLCGDMILSVKNELGSCIVPPSTVGKQSQQALPVDWFREVVALFKSSHELHFMIRRVGSLSNSG